MKKKIVSLLLITVFILSIMPLNTVFALSYSNYSTVPIDSYDSFRNAVIGKAFNVDGAHGAQCWDGACVLWKRLGMNLQTGNGYAKGCWQIKMNENAGSSFDLIYSINEVMRGDVVVFSNGTTGHIAFADENYDGSGAIDILGQNQGKNRTPVNDSCGCYESAFNITSMSVSTFLGAFRYRGWSSITKPIISVSAGKSTENTVVSILNNSSARNTDYYEVRIFNAFTNELVDVNWGCYDIVCRFKLPAGTYYATATAIDSSEINSGRQYWMQSDHSANFVVEEGKAIGDLNGDGEVTEADAIYLLFYTFFPEIYPVSQDCDYDNDGEVTEADAVYLLFHTFFPDEYKL